MYVIKCNYINKVETNYWHSSSEILMYQLLIEDHYYEETFYFNKKTPLLIGLMICDSVDFKVDQSKF